MWLRSFALRVLYGTLKLRDEFLAQKWRTTLAIAWAGDRWFDVTRFLGHWFPSLGFLTCREIALINGRPVAVRFAADKWSVNRDRDVVQDDQQVMSTRV